jgi:hypothetical protein
MLTIVLFLLYGVLRVSSDVERERERMRERE